MVAFRDKRVVVIGLGTSGVAACELVARRGARVVATDKKDRAALGSAADRLERAGVELVLGDHDAALARGADLVVVSPGVPPFAALAGAEHAGVPVWGEVELAVRSLSTDTPVVAVGGTNGKSTTTSLVGRLLGRLGLRTFTGGNLGEPLAAHADEIFDVVVLEVSSFQMERVERFRPLVSVLLNVSPDHLDRYDSFDAYAAAKGNAFARQESTDLAVVPAGDATCLAQARRGRAAIATFGKAGGRADVEVTDDLIVDHATGASYRRSAIRLQGGHNALNVAAAVAAVRRFSIPSDVVREVLETFEGLPHRMALVGEHRGVRFYDDSKGTNVGAAVTALSGVTEPSVVLIAGGRDKGGSYAPLADALRAKGRAAVILGEAADAIAAALEGVVPIRRAASMDDAVREAAELAQRGDAVLLSPACSSFDMFRDYKERGDAFARAVGSLGGAR